MSEDLVENFDSVLMIRVSSVDKKFLQKYCIDEGKSVSEMIRNYIKDLMEEKT